MGIYHKYKKVLPLFLIVLILLLLSTGLLIYQNLTEIPGQSAMIYQNGILLKKISLEGHDAPYIFTIDAPEGGYNTIQVEEGKIGVIDTDCPDKICQKMGMISTDLYPISCLPHKLIIQVTTSEQTHSPSEELDSITK